VFSVGSFTGYVCDHSLIVHGHLSVAVQSATRKKHMTEQHEGWPVYINSAPAVRNV